MKAPIRLRLSSSVVIALLTSLVALASAGCATTRAQDSSLDHPYRERFVAVEDSRTDTAARPVPPSKDRTREVHQLWH